MTTLTYVKRLPTPAEELNSLGLTEFEMFLSAYSPVFHKAACETANHLLSGQSFNKSSWNTHLQKSYGISKRHANGVISHAQGAVDASKEHRKRHVKALEGKLKSITSWISKSKKKITDSTKFYSKNNWHKSKTGCRFPLSCSIQHRDTGSNTKKMSQHARCFKPGNPSRALAPYNYEYSSTPTDQQTKAGSFFRGQCVTNWQNLRFQLHNKKRRAHQLTKQIEHLKVAPIQTLIPKDQAFVVGSKDESFGNQVCQWDGDILKFRVPACLESKFGKHVQTKLGNFDRNINRLPKDGSKTWHFYRKNGEWNAAVQFTPAPVKRISRHSAYGCIGIDINPGSIGWAYVDRDGNLKAHGQIPLQMGLPSGKQDAQIVDACLQLATLANTFSCPVVCEELDFSTKKEQLSERGRKYARMLSGWAYSRFYELLESILSNRGIYLIQVNPAYTSVIGLVKYARQYGLASDEAAAMAIARRGMRLSENIPGSITAYLSVKDGKHVWSLWNQLNNLIKKSSIRRHSFYAISNWESLVKQRSEQSVQSKPRR